MSCRSFVIMFHYSYTLLNTLSQVVDNWQLIISVSSSVEDSLKTETIDRQDSALKEEEQIEEPDS